MNIYIYGNNSFKKEIHETLEHSNIKFKLDESTLIKEIDDLSQLKQTIKNNPKDIYLIDDERIIQKNSLNKKIKFFTPKDGIEEEFLLDSGISDLSINSLSEIPKNILRKYDEEKKMNSNIQEELSNNSIDDDGKENRVELDDELAQLLAKEESNQEIKVNKNFDGENLEELFDMRNDINLGDPENMFDTFDNIDNNSIEISKNEFDDIMNFNDDFGLNNISFDYDDNDVLSKNVDESKNSKLIEELDFLGEEVVGEEEDYSDLEKVNNELFGGFDFLNEEIQEGKKKEEIFPDSDKIEEDLLEEEVIEEYDFMNEYIKNEDIEEVKEIDQSLEGDKMNDEFFELDSLSENDLLEALNYKVEDNSSKSEYKPQVSSTKSETLSIDSSNVNDLSLLISKLLNNKTLEITIKIKD